MQKNQRKMVSTFLSSFLLFTSFLLLLAPVPVRADHSWTDPEDDIRCFTEDDVDDFDFGFEGDATAEDIVKAVKTIWSRGSVSATPDYIDMTKIITTDWSDTTTMQIYVQGLMGQGCKLFVIYGKCVGVDTDYGLMVLVGCVEDIYRYTDESGTTITGTPDVHMHYVEFTYPNSAESDCDLTILAIDLAESHSCADIFPNSGSTAEGTVPNGDASNPSNDGSSAFGSEGDTAAWWESIIQNWDSFWADVIASLEAALPIFSAWTLMIGLAFVLIICGILGVKKAATKKG